MTALLFLSEQRNYAFNKNIINYVIKTLRIILKRSK